MSLHSSRLACWLSAWRGRTGWLVWSGLHAPRSLAQDRRSMRRLQVFRRQGGLRLAPPAEYRPRDPQRGQQHQRVGQYRSVLTLRPVGFGRNMPVLVVERQHARLGRLVERVDEQLQREQHEEYRGHLEEEPQVDAVAVAGPAPGETRGQGDPEDRAPEKMR